MSQWHTDWRTARLLLIAAVLVVGGGCATTDRTPGTGKPKASAKADGAEGRRESTSHVEVDGPYGFTVTEVVRIGSDVRNDYQRAVGLLEREAFDEGISLLESVVERAPDVTIPHIDLGVAYGRRGEHDKAEASLRTALSLAPNHPVALNEMGIVYRRTGKFDAARDHYQRALAIYPSYHYALRNLGVLCDLYLEDLSCALENYERYAEIVVDDPEVTIWIADIRNRLGHVDEE
jgi:Flp pilus assembly protein TadD